MDLEMLLIYFIFKRALLHSNPRTDYDITFTRIQRQLKQFKGYNEIFKWDF